MAGKAGRSGRPKGSRSFNSTRLCIDRLNVLIESWLIGVPASEIRIMLPLLAGCPEQQLIDECWNNRGNDERLFQVPPQIKQKLARIARAAETKLQQQMEDGSPEIDDIQNRLSKKWPEAEAKLRDMGWTDQQIGAHYNKLFSEQKPKKPFEPPRLWRILKGSRRRAPGITARRKVRQLKSDC
jgi:hypothetical protein